MAKCGGKKPDESNQTDKENKGMPIQTFVFMDLEATGLPSGKKLPDVIELAMRAVPRKALTKASTEADEPRVQDKLLMCITPEKPVVPRAQKMTGLSKDMLEKYGKQRTNKLLVVSVKSFLLRQAEPVCLVAHAGDRFDFKVLKREMGKVRTSDSFWNINLYTIDSLLFFQKVLPGESHTLSDLCDNYLTYEPSSHTAEGDTETLLDLVSLPAFMCKFLNWTEQNKSEYEL
ncbi:three-prime repair exonuclease 1-like [Ptychodera flava]|uniref:three-prime repair exonuclease 1-like n=1 Tax=Ptychodera flava TaxID=63121 RepID=UPI00396A62BB